MYPLVPLPLTEPDPEREERGLPPFVHPIRAGGRPIYLSSASGARCGRLALEIMRTFSVARRDGAAVMFARDPNAADSVLYSLQPVGVEVLDPRRAAGVALRLRMRLFRQQLRFPEAVAEGVQAQIRAWLRAGRLPGSVAGELKRYRHRSAPTADAVSRRTLLDSVPVALDPTLARVADIELAKLGVDDGPIVCVHAREDPAQRDHRLGDAVAYVHESIRSARIGDYRLAIDRMLDRGYTVVRIGRSATSTKLPGLIEIPRSTPGLSLPEVACLLRARLFLCGESGPFPLALLMGIPLLCVNATDVLGAYPVRPDGFLLPKTAVERSSRTPLRTIDRVSDEFLERVRKSTSYYFVDNSPEEIATATDEALDWVEGKGAETDRQRRFRELATAAAQRDVVSGRRLREWGSDEGFLGEGRLVDLRLAGFA